MSHSIIIINERLDALIADATKGFLFDFKQTVNTADTWAQSASAEDAETMHEYLHDTQDLVDRDYELDQGIEQAVASIVDDMNTLMGI